VALTPLGGIEITSLDQNATETSGLGALAAERAASPGQGLAFLAAPCHMPKAVATTIGTTIVLGFTFRTSRRNARGSVVLGNGTHWKTAFCPSHRVAGAHAPASEKPRLGKGGRLPWSKLPRTTMRALDFTLIYVDVRRAAVKATS
jgi:hypothetical protein